MLTFTTANASAQAAHERPRGQALPNSRVQAIVAAYGGVLLSNRSREPLVADRGGWGIEAGVVWQGGAQHEWESTVRVLDANTRHEVALTLGPRITFDLNPRFWSLVPVVRGGVRVGYTRQPAQDRQLLFGPHFGLGVERAFGPGILAMEVLSQASLTPSLHAYVLFGLSLRTR